MSIQKIPTTKVIKVVRNETFSLSSTERLLLNIQEKFQLCIFHILILLFGILTSGSSEIFFFKRKNPIFKIIDIYAAERNIFVFFN